MKSQSSHLARLLSGWGALSVVLLLGAMTPARSEPAASSRSPGPERFALQVGINQYRYLGPDNQLYGCIQDVDDMKQVLVDKFGFPPAHILTLKNGQATHAAVVKAFREQLIANAKLHPNAVVVFQFSGHGSLVDDATGETALGQIRTLVPADSRDIEGKNFDITQDELSALFAELAQYTPNALFVFDSCHSGQGSRSLERMRGIPKDTRPQPPRPAGLPPARRAGARGIEEGGMLPPSGRYVMIAACMPLETAGDAEGQRHNGLMTFHLVQALKHAQPGTSYREMMQEVANAVSQENPDQHPQVIGDALRPVLGGTASREDPFIAVKAVHGRRLTIGAGKVHGVKPGAIIAIYSPTARRLVGETGKLTSATVSKVDPFTAEAEMPKVTAIPLTAKVVLVTPNFGSTPLRVAMVTNGAADGSTRLAGDLQDRLKDSPLVQFTGAVQPGPVRAGQTAPPDVAVMSGPFRQLFPDDGSIAPPAPGQAASPLPAPTAPVYYLAAPDGQPLFGFFVQPSDPDAAEKISEALQKIAQRRNVQGLSNEASPLNGNIQLTILRVHTQQDEHGNVVTDPSGSPGHEEEEAVPLSAGQLDYPLDQGSRFRIQMTNQSQEPLYVTLFDLSNDGAIKIMYPTGGVAEELDPGRSVKTGVWRTSGPRGHEIIKVIATTSRTDFGFLQQSGITRGGMSPVERLLAQAYGKTRAVAEEDSGRVDSWSAAEINFDISSRSE